MINIILADDQEILRESLKSVIEQEPEFKVVAVAGNGLEALKLCDKLLPDVVLMDVQMPTSNGIEGTRLIKEKYTFIKVLMLTSFEDEEYISKALAYGAEGYLLKDVKPDMLKSAIKSVYLGIPVMHKNVFAILKRGANNLSSSKELSKAKNIQKGIQFTSKELEIIGLITKGKSNTDIAREVCLSKGRVANIITSIFEKVGLSDRTELAVYAVRNNFV